VVWASVGLRPKLFAFAAAQRPRSCSRGRPLSASCVKPVQYRRPTHRVRRLAKLRATARSRERRRSIHQSKRSLGSCGKRTAGRLARRRACRVDRALLGDVTSAGGDRADEAHHHAGKGSAECDLAVRRRIRRVRFRSGPPVLADKGYVPVS